LNHLLQFIGFYHTDWWLLVALIGCL